MSLEELIAQSTRRKKISRCWASALEGDAARYVAALDEIESERPGSVVRQEVAQILAEKFGLVMTASPVENHFARKCRCGR